ncbi:MAG: class IV adenylate cyclase [Leeuwenhoekiella sp.]
MFEVELKALVHNKTETIKRLESLSGNSLDKVRYDDIYFDKEDNLKKADKELRIREKTNLVTQEKVCKLTFKDAPFDQKSKSKPEFETEITDFNTGIAIFQKLGYVISTQYTKNCLLCDLIYKHQKIEIAVVEISMLKDTFIEVEIQTENQQETAKLFIILYSFLEEIGISKDEVTNEYYVDAIKNSTT